MNPQQLKEFEDMKKFIEGLKRQQIKAPLDPVSQQILFDNVPVVKAWTAGVAASNGYLTARFKGKSYKIMTRA